MGLREGSAESVFLGCIFVFGEKGLQGTALENRAQLCRVKADWRSGEGGTAPKLGAHTPACLSAAHPSLAAVGTWRRRLWGESLGPPF